ncbi:MAG: ABC transporter ATP-binding protein [Chloroflexi bacterium]|jgi:ABC-2 type transport system ATP-binding protein|nr:ABC transporter ATP-binding protein [Chloroflexota bacterium]MBT7080534.1 ABC transporter ATP-binding protein [Chloroflexota bacterium]MBT7290806.1 ABC transporter ATP-binding protein [Chloroflexota bacterium]
MNNIIEVNNLRKTYGEVVAVDEVSFNVKEGEIFGLLGPNGAGKTTTVECLQGLRQSFTGDVRVLGLNPHDEAQDIRRQIGSQLQESALPDRIKVWEALDLFASLTPNGLDWEALLEQWGLTEKRSASFSSLSGGQRQRLFIALALVNDPKIVFLDEMTQGLDPAARHVAWDLIRAIRDKGKTVVMVTHFMDEAETLCDRLAIVDHGTIIATDTPQGLINTYASKINVLFSTDQSDISYLEQITEVEKVTKHGSRVEVKGTGAVLAVVAHSLVEHGITPSDLRVEQPSLEDVFLNLTSGAPKTKVTA